MTKEFGSTKIMDYLKNIDYFFVHRSVSNAGRLNKLTGLHLLMFFDLKREVSCRKLMGLTN